MAELIILCVTVIISELIAGGIFISINKNNKGED